MRVLQDYFITVSILSVTLFTKHGLHSCHSFENTRMLLSRTHGEIALTHLVLRA